MVWPTVRPCGAVCGFAMIGGGSWEVVGLLDKPPVQVAAAGAAAVRIRLCLRFDRKIFPPNPLAIAIRLLAEGDRAAEFRVALSTGRDGR